MALKDLTQGDFQYFKSYSEEMVKCHEREFMRMINPELIRAMYRGKTDKEEPNKDPFGFYNNYYNEEDHLLALVKMFQAANTILPNLYFQAPTPIVIPKRTEDSESAALMCAGLKHYKKLNQAKKQNQESVLNSYFFGIGWKKMGYRSVYAPVTKEPETELSQDILSKIKQTVSNLIGGKGSYDKSKPIDAESGDTPKIADYETLFNDSENPLNVATDHKTDLFNAKARLYSYNRTLYDIINTGCYEKDVVKEIREMFKRKNGTRFDEREVEFVLRELHIIQRNGLWILSYVDEFAKPLRYDKSGWEGKGFLDSPIVLTNEPGCRYPTSHMRVGAQVQKKLDKLATMYVEMVARSRRMLAVNTDKLQPGQEAQLEANLIQGILKVKTGFNPNVDMANISSAPVSNDLPNLMGMLTQIITEVTGADSQLITGQSKNKTLGQDELARVGTQIRESGMVDRIRDWEIDQLQKEGTLLKQYSNTELNFVITKSDYQDPSIIQQVEDKWVEFMTPNNPLGLKQYLQGEFDYDCNIEESQKPNKAQQGQNYQQIILAGSNPTVQQALENRGMILAVDELFKLWMETCEGIGNTDRFLEQLDSQQLAALQTKRILAQNGAQMMQQNQQNAVQHASNAQQGQQAQEAQNQQNKMGVTSPSSEMAGK